MKKPQKQTVVLPEGGRHSTMSLLEFFAAHAPDNIPAWFKLADPPQVPPVLDIDQALAQTHGYSELSDADKETVHVWMRDPIFDLDEKLAPIGRAADGLRQMSSAIHQEAANNAKATLYFAWRWHYAMCMLNAKPQPIQPEGTVQ